MKALVDTHTFLWALLNDHRLSATAKRRLITPGNELYFSMVSLWEIAIKIKTGKLNAIGSSVSYLHDEMEAYGMKMLPIRYEHVLELEKLPRLHADPFDRLMIAQALYERMPVITHDSRFVQYGVEVIW